jgi:hypothetical protein
VNIRIALIGAAMALVAGTALLGSPASARAIRTDSGTFGPLCAANTTALNFNPGLTGTPDACSFLSPIDDQGSGDGPFESDLTTVYTWDDDNAALNWNSSVQVVVYSLDGNDGSGSPTSGDTYPTSLVTNGDTEFAFNYNAGDGSCLVNPPALSSTPTLTFDGVTYQFTGAKGAGICDPASTSDFVFSSASYIGWIDDTSTLQTSGLPPGWSVVSAAVSEPDSLGLTLIGGSLAAAFALGRRRRTNR